MSFEILKLNSTANRQRIRYAIGQLSNLGAVRNQTRVLGIVSYTMLRRRIFEELEIDLVIDVGANVGQFGRSLREFYRGDIISFEPVPHVFKVLSENTKGDEKWHCRNMALGSEQSNLIIHVPTDNTMSSFHKMNDFCESKFSLDADQAVEFEVSVNRLDTVLDSIIPNWRDRSIFLKMDTQGYDLQVFQGVGKIMERVVALQSEISQIPLYEGMPDWKESLAIYGSAGFELSGLFPVTMDHLSAIEFDCLMTKRK